MTGIGWVVVVVVVEPIVVVVGATVVDVLVVVDPAAAVGGCPTVVVVTAPGRAGPGVEAQAPRSTPRDDIAMASTPARPRARRRGETPVLPPLRMPQV